MIPTLQSSGLRKHPLVRLNDPYPTSANASRRYSAPWSTQPVFTSSGLQAGVVDFNSPGGTGWHKPNDRLQYAHESHDTESASPIKGLVVQLVRQIHARFVAWVSRRQSRQKAGHRFRQDKAVRVITRVADIHGDNPSATFAMRLAYLRKIDPLVFEEMVLDAFASKGYQVQRGTRYSGDGGLDGRVHKNGTWHGIQCKRYRGAIHTPHIERFSADLMRERLPAGFFVHTGKTPSAARLSCPAHITLLSGRELVDFLCQQNFC